jgi:hypothetical protein
MTPMLCVPPDQAILQQHSSCGLQGVKRSSSRRNIRHNLHFSFPQSVPHSFAYSVHHKVPHNVRWPRLQLGRNSSSLQKAGAPPAASASVEQPAAAACTLSQRVDWVDGLAWAEKHVAQSNQTMTTASADRIRAMAAGEAFNHCADSADRGADADAGPRLHPEDACAACAAHAFRSIVPGSS